MASCLQISDKKMREELLKTQTQRRKDSPGLCGALGRGKLGRSKVAKIDLAAKE